MGSHQRAEKSNEGADVQSTRKIEPLTAALLLLCLALCAAIAYVSLPRATKKVAGDLATLTPTAETSPPPSANHDETAAAPSSKTPATDKAATASASPGFDRLKGRWLRPDGNYVVEVKSVDAGGKMDASYFNPQSIHVAKAEASRDGNTLKVFVELRDASYPGCTYTLTYDPTSDQLQGVYYQASLQQSYDVVFVRLKPEQ